MFNTSRYPTRLLVRCPHCHQYASVNRDVWVARQTFCSFDGSPMFVVSVSTGVELPGGDWPGLVNPRPMTAAEAGLPPTAVIGFCACTAEAAAVA